MMRRSGPLQYGFRVSGASLYRGVLGLEARPGTLRDSIREPGPFLPRSLLSRATAVPWYQVL